MIAYASVTLYPAPVLSQSTPFHSSPCATDAPHQQAGHFVIFDWAAYLLVVVDDESME